jgi:hypothetical protein
LKISKKLSAIVLSIVIIGGGLVYGLTPDESIESKDKLANVSTTMTVDSLNKDLAKNVSIEQFRNLSSTIKLDNSKFQSLLKNSVDKNSALLEGSYKIERSHINAKLPIKVLGVFDTIVYSNISVAGEGNSLTLTLEDAKMGKLPIPSFILEKYLKEALTGTSAEVKGNVITINSLPLKIAGAYISIDNEIVTKVSLDFKQVATLNR